MCATTVRLIHCCLASTAAVRRLCATLAGAVPKCHWDTHKLSIDGLVDQPTTFSMDDLYAMPSREIPVTLVCAGNRRKEENLVKQTVAPHS
jgi:DMSO/TMAO reductase YedYZ molybdopterin-dependent catalytic subunit